MAAEPDQPDRHRLRRGLAWAALVVGCLALLLANLAVFLKAFVFDEDTFVDAVAPEKADETVIDGLADTLSSRIVDAPAVQDRLADLTPTDNPLVAGVVSDSARDLIDSALRTVLASDAFRSVWRGAVTRAHRELVDVIENDDREPIVLNLTQALSDVDQRLERRGIDILDDATIEDIGQVVTVRRSQVDEVRGYLDLLQRSTLPLVVLALGLLAAAVALATERRRMLLFVGVGMVLAMVVTGIALRIARNQVTDRIEVDARRDAVASLWGRVFDSLVHQTVALLVIGLVLVAIAWLIGQSPASTLRHRVHRPGPPAPAATA
jgi:hypothetical protein